MPGHIRVKPALTVFDLREFECRSKSSFFDKSNNVAHLLLCFLAEFCAVNAFVFPPNKCDAQSLKILSFGGGEIALYQSCFMDKGRNEVFEGTFVMLNSGTAFVHEFSPDFMLPTFHKSHERAPSAGDSRFTVALADKPIRQKSDGDAAAGGNESTDKRGGNFVNELARLILLALTVFVGTGIALLFAVPIGKAVCFILDISARFFGRYGG